MSKKSKLPVPSCPCPRCRAKSGGGCTRCPGRIYYLRSDNKRGFPKRRDNVVMFLDENIWQRLWAPNTSRDFSTFAEWLRKRKGKNISASNTTIALEHTHSAHSLPFYQAKQLEELINSIVLTKKSKSFFDFVPAGVPFLMTKDASVIAAQILTAMAEIAWAKEICNGAYHCEKYAHNNALLFLTWRELNLQNTGPTASTMLVLGALLGNAAAISCLKLKRKDRTGTVLRNAAFDAVHLTHYLEAGGVAEGCIPRKVAIFATADKALAEFIEVQKTLDTEKGVVLASTFNTPWVSARKMKNIITAYHQLSDMDPTESPLVVGQRATTALVTLQGHLAAEPRRLWLKLQELLTDTTETIAPWSYAQRASREATIYSLIVRWQLSQSRTPLLRLPRTVI